MKLPRPFELWACPERSEEVLLGCNPASSFSTFWYNNSISMLFSPIICLSIWFSVLMGDVGLSFRFSSPPCKKVSLHFVSFSAGTSNSLDKASKASPRRSRRTISCFRFAVILLRFSDIMSLVCFRLTCV